MIWWQSITTIEQILYIVSAFSLILLVVDLFIFLQKLKKEKYFQNQSLVNYIFTFRSLYILISVGCWSTIIAFKALRRIVPSFAIGVAFGLIVLIAFALCLRYALKLNGFEWIELSTLIGNEGIVYSLIPLKGEGRGKVSLIVNGKMRVFDAVAYEDNKIPSGSDVKVIDALGKDLLLVESVKEVK